MKAIDKALNSYNIYNVVKFESKKQIKDHLRYYSGLRKISDTLIDELCKKLGIQNANYTFE